MAARVPGERHPGGGAGRRPRHACAARPDERRPSGPPLPPAGAGRRVPAAPRRGRGGRGPRVPPGELCGRRPLGQPGRAGWAGRWARVGAGATSRAADGGGPEGARGGMRTGHRAPAAAPEPARPPVPATRRGAAHGSRARDRTGRCPGSRRAAPVPPAGGVRSHRRGRRGRAAAPTSAGRRCRGAPARARCRASRRWPAAPGRAGRRRGCHANPGRASMPGAVAGGPLRHPPLDGGVAGRPRQAGCGSVR